MRISDWSSDVCSSDLTGELRVGGDNSIGNFLCGDLLGPFVALHPAVSLHVSVENTDTIAAGLLAHRIDVGCVEGPVNHPQLEVLPWRDDALVICAAPLHPLAQSGELKARHFKDAKWILRRSEERRDGKEVVSKCRSRWSPYH